MSSPPTLASNMNAMLPAVNPQEYIPHRPRSIPEAYPYYHYLQPPFEPRETCCSTPLPYKQLYPVFHYYPAPPTSTPPTSTPGSASTPTPTSTAAPTPIPLHFQPPMPHRESPVPASPVAYCAMATPAGVSSPAVQWPTPFASGPVTAEQEQRQQQQHHDSEVAQALEIARESEDGASNPTIAKMLNEALTEIWNKVLERNDYVMTKDEFAIFNYFQHRFKGNELAVQARMRFWGPPPQSSFRYPSPSPVHSSMPSPGGSP